MLKIPEPQQTSSFRVTLTNSTKREFDTYVSYIKSKQPHASQDAIIEAMIQKIIPRAGVEAKSYTEFKKSLKGES